MSDALPFRQPDTLRYSTFIVHSYRRWTGSDLIAPAASDVQLAEALYRAPFVVLSHGGGDDPVFCYANLAAQDLWQLPWEEFVRLPSRLSAEADARAERQRLLDLAEAQGYVDNYSGVRITSGGRRFRINRCLLWNVINKSHDKIGQAATFSNWEWL